MGYKKLYCPSCGANIEIDDNREFGFCSYCGAKIVQDKLIVEHRGNITLNGLANVSSLLERAKMYLEGGKFSDALQYCERALDINPKNADAYILRLMAETDSCSREELGNSIKPLNTYDSYNKAIKFSSSEEGKMLASYNEQSIKNYNAELQKRESLLDKEKEELKIMRRNLQELTDKAKRTGIWISMNIPLTVVEIVICVILLGTSEIKFPFVIIAVALFFILKKLKKNAENNNADRYYYEQKTMDKEKVVSAKKEELQRWINKMKKID